MVDDALMTGCAPQRRIGLVRDLLLSSSGLSTRVSISSGTTTKTTYSSFLLSLECLALGGVGSDLSG
jgi:hypothetical protein